MSYWRREKNYFNVHLPKKFQINNSFTSLTSPYKLIYMEADSSNLKGNIGAKI